MKKTLILLCASVFMLTAWTVQAAEKPEDMPPPQKERIAPPEQRLADDLGLSDEQKAQAEKLRTDSREKMKPLFEQMKELRAKMDELRKENMAAFEELLTPEQKNRFDQMKKDHPRPPHRRKGPHWDRRGGPDDMPPPPPHHEDRHEFGD